MCCRLCVVVELRAEFGDSASTFTKDQVAEACAQILSCLQQHQEKEQHDAGQIMISEV